MKSIPRMSPELRAALADELENFPEHPPEIAAVLAMRALNERINRGEPHLFDPTNSGDAVALALGSIG